MLPTSRPGPIVIAATHPNVARTYEAHPPSSAMRRNPPVIQSNSKGESATAMPERLSITTRASSGRRMARDATHAATSPPPLSDSRNVTKIAAKEYTELCNVWLNMCVHNTSMARVANPDTQAIAGANACDVSTDRGPAVGGFRPDIDARDCHAPCAALAK